MTVTIEKWRALIRKFNNTNNGGVTSAPGENKGNSGSEFICTSFWRHIVVIKLSIKQIEINIPSSITQIIIQ